MEERAEGQVRVQQTYAPDEIAATRVVAESAECFTTKTRQRALLNVGEVSAESEVSQMTYDHVGVPDSFHLSMTIRARVEGLFWPARFTPDPTDITEVAAATTPGVSVWGLIDCEFRYPELAARLRAPVPA